MKTFLKDAKRLLHPAWENKSLMIKTIAINWIFSMFIVWNIFMLPLITKHIENWDIQSLKTTITIYILFLISYHFITFFSRHRWWASSYYEYTKYLQDLYIPKLIKLDNNEFEKIWTWKIISIITKALQNWTDTLIAIFWVWTRIFFSLFYSCYVIYNYGIIYLLEFLAIISILHIFAWFMNNFAIKYRTLKNENDNESSRQLVRIIMSKFEILQNNKTKQEIEKLDIYANISHNLNIKLNNFLFFMYSSSTYIITILRISSILIIWYWIYYKTHSFSEFVWIITVIAMLENTMRSSIDFYKSATSAIIPIKRMWELFDSTKDIQGFDVWKDFILQKWNIKIENLNFSYWEKNSVFENFNLEIKWWHKTAFVWVSWSWKSTLIKLICWYLSPESWNIYIDEQNLSYTKLNTYYPKIWYLTQEPNIFDGTIIENILYWTQDQIDLDKLHEIIKLSKCDFIYWFKNWLDTQIWEKGIRLSWWQKQRLAIAKIMMKNPGIIILDEPTSALDSFSEEQITLALNNLFQWKTVIIIAHRLQTVKNADDIIVLEKWKITERGTHQDLISQNWTYKKMLELQSGLIV